jgi:predicted RNase H-like nuclease (RuvC/YqgF family)
MEEQANNLPTLIAATVTFLGCAGALVTAVAAWFKQKTETEKQKTALQEIINSRAETKAARDEDSRKMHDQIIILEQTVNNLKSENAHLQVRVDDTNIQINTLTTQLAQVIVKMDNIIETLKELKEQNKNG